VTTTMAFEIDLDCTERCFGLPDWRELLEHDPDSHIFATPEWNRLWWEEFGAGKQLYFLTMRRDAEIRAIVPMYLKEVEGRNFFRFVGGIDLTDYLGPICSLEDRDDVAESLVGWFDGQPVAWDELDAHNMPVPFGFAEFLVDHADRQGFEFKLDQEETSAVLPLPGDWDEYVEGLRSKQRHELRRKRRRLGRDYPDAVFRTTTEESLERDLEIFVEMHRGAEGYKGHFMRPEIATFFERIAHAFMPLGWLRMDFLEVGDRAIASTFSFERDGVFYLYNSAFESDAASISPGFVLVSELIKSAIARGVRRFDFLRGPERYKYELGAQAVPLHNVKVRNNGARATG
jgi:CelD/BcsL family acetyltransferase involved in cellulose biosynthesis